MAASSADFHIVPVVDDAGIADWAAVYNTVMSCLPVGPQLLRHVWEHAPEWESVIVVQSGRVVGAAHAEVQHWSPGATAAEIDLVVLADSRRRGIGSALYAHLSRWASEHDLDELDIWVRDGAPDAPGFWARRGYREVGREQRARLELGAGPPVDVVPPVGVRIVTFRDAGSIDAGLYAVAQEAIPDVPGPDGYAPGDLEHFLTGEIYLPGMMPDCSVVAVADETIVGYAVLIRSEAEPGVASHEMTAVKRDWRGRGIARAMKETQIQLARAAGLEALETENEVRNLPMLAVNGRLGYAPLPAYVQLRGPLAASADRGG